MSNFPVMDFRFSYQWVLGAAMFCGLFVCTSCENKRSDIESITKRKTGVEIAKDVTIIYTIGAKTKSRITAPVMLRHVESNPIIEFPNTLKADFFNDSLKIDSHLSAMYGRYLESESKVFLRDSVVLYNTIGDTLFCRELYWDRNRPGHEFYTDKPVRIRTLTHILDGDALDAPQDFKSWHLTNVRGIVRVPDSELP